MLAIVRALYEWCHYVIGKKFDIWSDHKNLSWFMTKQNLNRRQARWASKLAEFDFLLHYRKGSTMVQADALSRRHDLRGEVEHDNIDQILLQPHRFADLRELSTTMAINLVTGTLLHTKGDAIVNKIRDSTSEYDLKVIIALKEANQSLSNIASDMANWAKEDGIVTRNGLVVVPRDRELQRKIIELYHDGPISGHPGRLKT
jgi:DNA-binding HxlR family transcriptional regulator